MPSWTDVVIDPPWEQRKGGRRSVRPNQGRSLDYETITVSEIFALLDREIFPQAAERHNVWLWAFDKFLCDAEREMSARGYKLHARLIWDKGNGIAPAFTVRYAHEYLLWFYKGGLTPIANEARGKQRTDFSEPQREHSRKPNYAYSMIMRFYPNGARIDVFSREHRIGWEQWGNQCSHFEAALL